MTLKKLRSHLWSGMTFGMVASAILLVATALLPENSVMPLVERGLLYLSFLLLSIALFKAGSQVYLLRFNFLILLTLSLILCFHLALDHFQYHYVWLYSAPDLKLYLKISNLWGGEEGTLLFLSLLLSFFSLRVKSSSLWTGKSLILLTLPFIAGLLIWHPFGLTTVEEFAHAPYQGMNAHLTKFWMAIHPPLIFITYILLLLPVGAAFQALVHQTGDFKMLALKYSRPAWVVLTAGMVSGMWWAYEDYFYGQFWHWDPVQTASFIVWCFLTAYLHGLRNYHPQGAYERILPFLSILTAAAAVGSMLVTRNGELMSSHRYLGDTSVALLSFISAALFLAAFTGLFLAYRAKYRAQNHKKVKKQKLNDARLMIWIAIWGFFIFGLIGCYFLGEAYLRALLNIPKDKPPLFFALISTVSSSEFVEHLKTQHTRWSVDNFGVNQMMAPLLFIIAIIGGQKFLPLRIFETHPFKIFRRPLFVSIFTVFCCFILAEFIQPLEYFYDGTGLTSSKTRQNFYLLNMLLGAVFYFSVSSLLYILPSHIKEISDTSYRSYRAPVGLMHMGVMIAVFSALSASILDQNILKKITLPDDYGKKITLSKERSLIVQEPHYLPKTDHHIAAISRLHLTLMNARGEELYSDMHLLYQDKRPKSKKSFGAIRQYCEAVDYRFARSSRDNHHMIHPFIYRGLDYDLQIWLPIVYEKEKPAEYTLVVKKFPMMSFLWFGLFLTISAGLYYALVTKKR